MGMVEAGGSSSVGVVKWSWDSERERLGAGMEGVAAVTSSEGGVVLDSVVVGAGAGVGVVGLPSSLGRVDFSASTPFGAPTLARFAAT